jgi:predicted RNase H-like HicB family nuclease
MMTYTILAKRDETGMWVGTCEQIDGFVTQARRLDQLRRNAREAASVALDIDEDEITITLAAVHNDDVIAVCQANDADKRASELITAFARRVRATRASPCGTSLNSSTSASNATTNSSASNTAIERTKAPHRGLAVGPSEQRQAIRTTIAALLELCAWTLLGACRVLVG